MKNPSSNGVMRKKSEAPHLHPPHPRHSLPIIATATAKQKEVLILRREGLNAYQIARKLRNVDESSVRERFKQCEKKGFVIHEHGTYRLTESGILATKSCGVGGGGSEVFLQKSQHHNQLSCKILNLPAQFHQGYPFFQTMGAKHIFHNTSAKTWFMYYQSCTVRICYGTMEATMFVKEQTGYSNEEIDSKVWEQFVKYFEIVKNNGFSLDATIYSKQNPHFADPNGFFAKLASFSDGKGFKITTNIGDFWVDYSLGSIAEEETDSKDIAKRTESLARSAITSKSDFKDLDRAVASGQEHEDKLARMSDLMEKNVQAIIAQGQVNLIQGQNISGLTQSIVGLLQLQSGQKQPEQRPDVKKERGAYFG